MKGSINKGEAGSSTTTTTTTRRRKRNSTSGCSSSKRKSTTAVFCLWVVFIFTQFRSSISSSSIHRHDDMIGGGRSRFLRSGSVPFISGPSSRFGNNRRENDHDHHSPGLMFDEDKRKVHTGEKSCSSKKAIRRELEKKEQ